jgi:hypothetical protein
MVIMLNSYLQQESPEIWLKNGELSKILQDSSKTHSDTSIGKYNPFIIKTESDLCGFFSCSIFTNHFYFMLWLRTVILISILTNLNREGENDWALEI